MAECVYCGQDHDEEHYDAEALESGASEMFEEFIRMYAYDIYDINTIKAERNETIITSASGHTFRFSVVMDDEFSWVRREGGE